jgi:hypothetical protein
MNISTSLNYSFKIFVIKILEYVLRFIKNYGIKIKIKINFLDKL